MLSRSALLAARAARTNPARPVTLSMTYTAVAPSLLRTQQRTWTAPSSSLFQQRTFGSSSSGDNGGGLGKRHDKKRKGHDQFEQIKADEARRGTHAPKEIPRTEGRPAERSRPMPNATIPPAQERQSSQPASQPVEDAPSESMPEFKLPDLTQGIPSTLDAELKSLRKEKTASEPHLQTTPMDISPNLPHSQKFEAESAAEASSTEQQPLPKSSYVSSAERKRDRFAKLMYLIFAMTGVIGTVYLGRNWETEEEEKAHTDAPSGWGFSPFWNRLRTRWRELFEFYTEPAFPKLLPDPDPLWERPLTLVLSLEDMLVHSEWTREHGWRTAKRPGIDYFLQYLSQYYELVVFTSLPSHLADPILKKLDPYRFIMWPLFREATRYKKGEYIKDLSFLNRPLSKVLILDTDPAHVQAQPDNAIVLKKWDGSSSDKGLIAMIPFLEWLATMGSKDVPSVIRSYHGKDVPTEFALLEANMRKEHEKLLANGKTHRKHSASGFLNTLMGTKPHGNQEITAAEAVARGQMLLDYYRERGQRHYEMMAKELREKGDLWLAELQAEEKKMQDEALKNMKSSALGMFGVPPAAAPQGSPKTE